MQPRGALDNIRAGALDLIQRMLDGFAIEGYDPALDEFLPLQKAEAPDTDLRDSAGQPVSRG
jgi:hypothetical protein